LFDRPLNEAADIVREDLLMKRSGANNFLDKKYYGAYTFLLKNIYVD
jgi:hypothetical protein